MSLLHPEVAVDQLSIINERSDHTTAEEEETFTKEDAIADYYRNVLNEKMTNAANVLQRAYRRHLARVKAARKATTFSKETMEWAKSYKGKTQS